MGIEFRIGEHTMNHKPMVEVMEDGKFIAGIYGHDDGIRIVSLYLDGVDHEPPPSPGFPPAVVVKLSDRK